MFDNDFVSKFLQDLILALIPVLIPVLVAFAVAAWKAVQAWIKTKTTPVVYDALTKTASIAVLAAEQMAKSGFIQQKKDYAVDMVSMLLKERGITLDLAVIQSAVEAAVWREFNEMKYWEVNDG